MERICSSASCSIIRIDSGLRSTRRAPSPSRSHIIHHRTRGTDDGTPYSSHPPSGRAPQAFQRSVYRVSAAVISGGRLQNSPLYCGIHKQIGTDAPTPVHDRRTGQRSARLSSPHAASFLGPLLGTLFFRKRHPDNRLRKYRLGRLPRSRFRHAEERRLPLRERSSSRLPQPTPGTAPSIAKEAA